MPKTRERATQEMKKKRLRHLCLGVGSLVVLAAVIRLSAAVSLAPIFAQPPDHATKLSLPAHILLAIDGTIPEGTEGSLFTVCLTVAVLEAMNLVHGIILLLTAQRELPTQAFLSHWSVSYASYHVTVMIVVVMYIVLLLGNGRNKEGILLLVFELSRLVLGAFFIRSMRDVRRAIVELTTTTSAAAAAVTSETSASASAAPVPAPVPAFTAAAALALAPAAPGAPSGGDAPLQQRSPWQSEEARDRERLLSPEGSGGGGGGGGDSSSEEE